MYVVVQQFGQWVTDQGKCQLMKGITLTMKEQIRLCILNTALGWRCSSRRDAAEGTLDEFDAPVPKTESVDPGLCRGYSNNFLLLVSSFLFDMGASPCLGS